VDGVLSTLNKVIVEDIIDTSVVIGVYMSMDLLGNIGNVRDNMSYIQALKAIRSLLTW
jgi:hypothetical protein